MRLIDADALENAIYSMAFDSVNGDTMWMRGRWIRYRLFTKCMEEAPTIDAELIRHSRWVLDRLSGNFYCPECLRVGSPHWKRCPICEAKMDGGDNK